MLQNEMNFWPISAHRRAISVLSQQCPFHSLSKQNLDRASTNQFQFDHEQGTSESLEMEKQLNSMVQLASSRSTLLMNKIKRAPRKICRLADTSPFSSSIAVTGTIALGKH